MSEEIVEIDLGHGRICTIDIADRPLVMRYSWRWSPHSKDSHFGYVVATGTKPNGKKGTFSLHRLLLDPPADKHVDHIDGNRLNNCRSNLRLASRSQNMANAKKCEGRGTSKYKGVYWNKQKNRWHAIISIGGRRKGLGFFRDEALAALAYDKAALEIAGEFAATNFPRSLIGLINKMTPSDVGINLTQKYE